MSHRTVAVTLAALALGAATALAAPKPLIQGTYEFRSIKVKKQPEQAIGPMLVDALKAFKVVGGRLLFTFDGDVITVQGQQLAGTPGAYYACIASVSGPVTWKAGALVVPNKLAAKSTHVTFTRLNATGADSDETHCSASVAAGTYAVTRSGDNVVLTSAAGEAMTFVPVPESEGADRPNWRTLLPKK